MEATVAQRFAVRYIAQTKALVLLNSFASHNEESIHQFGKAVATLNDPVDKQFVEAFQLALEVVTP